LNLVSAGYEYIYGEERTACIGESKTVEARTGAEPGNEKREVDEKAEIPFEEVRNWLGRVADAEEDAGISSFRCTDFEGVLDPTAVDELESSADDLEDLGGNNSAASASEVVTDSLGILRGHERGGDPVAT